MEAVLRQLNPSEEEIARLRGLLSAGRLAKPMLARRLSFEIDVVKRMAKSDLDSAGRRGFLLKLFAPDVARYEARCLSDIRKLKERWRLASSDPNVSEEVVFGQSDINSGAADELVLTRLRLAKTALAMEDYRLAYGKLPTALSELVSLSNEQRNLITWDPQANQLKGKPSANASLMNKWDSQPPSALVTAEVVDDDKDPGAAKHSPYIWNIRPSVTESGSVTSAMRSSQ
jgi:hypothetical protein